MSPSGCVLSSFVVIFSLSTVRPFLSQMMYEVERVRTRVRGKVCLLNTRAHEGDGIRPGMCFKCREDDPEVKRR